jgi:SAM-dependent methyltransferase
MTEKRGYQYDFSNFTPSMHDVEGRERKAATMVAVLTDYFDVPLSQLDALDLGASTGIIDNYLADHFHAVTGLDIDDKAIQSASNRFQKGNLVFQVGDALDTKLPSASVDVVICSQVYEHVPDAKAMIDEIFRLLRPGGICYFAAGNRFAWNEPHYNLPLLSAIPRPLAHRYIRLAGKAHHYHELHFSYWGLRRLVRRFEVHDYTGKLIEDPKTYKVEYMIPPGSRKHRIAKAIVRHAYWLVPSYIWLLRKPEQPVET